MKKYGFVFCALILVLAAVPAFAKSARKGFYIGFAPQITYAMSDLDEVGGGMNLQIGGGINEHVVLYANIQGQSYDVSGVTVSFGDLMFTGQYVYSDDMPFFVDLGLGTTTASADAGTGISVTSDTGFVTQVGAGYEWRTGEKFFMAPELIYNYRHIEGVDENSFGVSYKFCWYF